MDPTRVIRFLLFFLMVFGVVSIPTVGQKLANVTWDLKDPYKNFCGSREFRYTVSNMHSLQKCTVIVGCLSIQMVESSMSQNYSFKGLQFPELREVTDYVLLYRVENLESLGALFPNLMLIRGQRLILKYSFIIYDAPHLRELGLRSLTSIQRGYLRMYRNNQLCFLDTIDWTLITNKTEGHFFEQNGNELCPKAEACRGCERPLCWSSKNCQKLPDNDCSPQCIGGCNAKKECYRCKTLTDVDACVSACPKNKYEAEKMRVCVTKKQCAELYDKKGFTFNRKCIQSCPTGYKEHNKTCQFCEECVGVCRGAEIETLSHAQYFKDCTHINGSLLIRIQGYYSGDFMNDLEMNLGGIKEIKGYLKVYRSMTVTSLSFLKNLTLIKGEELEHDRYAFVVYEMDNIQSLFEPNTTKNVRIGNGTFFFHNNERLCLNEIYELQNVTRVEFTKYDVSPETNGFKTTCNVIALNSEHNVINQTHATITWQRFVGNMTSHTLDGYNIYFMENAPFNITEEFGRDSCYGNNWAARFVKDPQYNSAANLSYLVDDLAPSTRYAYYVETYSLAKEGYITDTSDKNGRSPIKFFTMEMDNPMKPQDVQSISYTHDSITIYWDDDAKYRGNITKHIIELHIHPMEPDYLDSRDYCYAPMVPQDEERPIRQRRPVGHEDDLSDPTCDCNIPEGWDELIRTRTLRLLEEEQNAHDCHSIADVVDFPDLMLKMKCNDLEKQRIKYLKPKNSNKTLDRTTRDTDVISDIFEDMTIPFSRELLENVTKNEKYHTYSTEFRAVHRNFTVTHLEPFSTYHIKFAACKGPNTTGDCGPTAQMTRRTLKHPDYDKIEGLRYVILQEATLEIHGSLDVYWDEPTIVNGAILTYTLDYARTDVENFKHITHCISKVAHRRNKSKFNLTPLHPGVYSISVRANSLAGNGNYTEPILVDMAVKIKFSWELFFDLGVLILFLIGGLTALLYCYRSRRQLVERYSHRQDDVISLLDEPAVRYVDGGEDEATVSILD